MSAATANQSLRRLNVLRLIELGGQIVAVAAATFWLKLDLPLAPIGLVMATLGAFTLVTALRLRWGGAVGERELFAHLLVDVTAITLLLYFTGGATNPFVSVYLLPLSVAAAMLAAPFAWGLTLLTVACYTLLLYYYVPLPGMEPMMPVTTLMGGAEHALHLHGEDRFGMHVIGMWLNFVISAGLITFFVQRIADSLRARERELAAAREAALRNERIIALGTLAAGTAHELGTPLSTVAVVAGELAEEFADDEELAPQLELIRTQVGQCKAVLQRLVESVGQLQAETRRAVTLVAYVEQLAERWRLLSPATPLALQIVAPGEACIRIDSTLEQALISLLANAAKASPAGIGLTARIEDGAAVLDILDRGPGVPEAVRASAGKRFLPEHSRDGMGIGLFLANATIERLGGSVQLSDREGGGARTAVRLPLDQGAPHE